MATKKVPTKKGAKKKMVVEKVVKKEPVLNIYDIVSNDEVCDAYMADLIDLAAKYGTTVISIKDVIKYFIEESDHDMDEVYSWLCERELIEDGWNDDMNGEEYIGTATVKKAPSSWHQANNKCSHGDSMDKIIGQKGYIQDIKINNGFLSYSIFFSNGDCFNFTDNVLENVEIYKEVKQIEEYPGGNIVLTGRSY